jgi:hypothetical protein
MIFPQRSETLLVGIRNNGCEDNSKDSIIEEYDIRFKCMHAFHLVANVIEIIFYSLHMRYGTFS